MEELVACRVCLITDVKLFDMHKYKLAEPYEVMTGIQISSDGLPRHICSLCATLLQKSVTFKNKCHNAQDLLQQARQHHKITTAYLRTIDRNSLSLSPPLTMVMVTENYIINEIEVTRKIKEEFSGDINYLDETDPDNISVKYESDEEPLAKIVKKRQRKPLKKTKIKVKSKIKVDKGKAAEKNNLESFNDIQVVILSKEQQIEEVESRKHAPNYLNSFYKCDKCFKGFLTESTFKNHMMKHAPVSGAHVCGVCGARWATRAALRAHGVTAHERQYRCRKCDHVSKSSHAAKEHSKWHLGFKYTCDTCGATFSKSSSHLTHIRIHHPSEHCCQLCGESFIGEYGLAMHRKKAHRDQEADAWCGRCAAGFRTAPALERHRALCRAGLRPCLTCGEGFSTDEKLKEHSKIHLKDNVKCEECNRTFAHQKSYALHYHRIHLRAKTSGRRDVACDRVVCEQCGKKCVSKAALRYHQRSHTGEKPYPCTVCSKRFTMPMFLQIHMRTHTGERPYACPRCTKAFSNRAALIRHNRVHTGAKPYPCPECDKRFTQSNSRKLHVATVHRRLPAPYGRPRAHRGDPSVTHPGDPPDNAAST